MSESTERGKVAAAMRLVVDSEEAVGILGLAGRTGVDYHVQRGHLVPVWESPRGRLFYVGDVESLALRLTRRTARRVARGRNS